MFIEEILLYLAESAWTLVLHLSAKSSFPAPLSAEEEAQAGLILQFCLLSLRLLWAMEQSGGELQELVRLWSAEIEYSDENIGKIVKAIKSLHLPKEQI